MADSNVIIGDWKAQRKGRNRKGIEWAMDIDVPGIRGTLNAKELGGVLANEMCDIMRHNWEAGKRASGQPPKVRYNEEMESGRAIKRALIEGAPLTGRLRDLTAWVSKALDASDDPPPWKTKKGRRQWIKRRAKLIQHYTATKRFGKINGFRRPARKVRYLPDPNNRTAVNDSGMMADFLSARYVPERRGTNKATGKSWHVRSQVIFSTTKSRQSAAFQYGGLDEVSPRQFVAKYRSSLRHTYKLWDNAVAWNDANQARTALFTTLRIVGRILQRIGPF